MEKQPVVLKTNPTLDSLVEGLSTYSADFDKMAEDFRRTEIFLKRNYRADTLRGFFGEMHLHNFLKDHPGLNLQPIRDGERNLDYIYRATAIGGVKIFSKRSGAPLFEYDGLARVDGLVTIFEVKITDSIHIKGKAHSGTLSKKLREESVNRNLRPFQTYFRRNEFGYVIVVTKNVVNSTSASLADFKTRGGIMTPIAYTLEEFETLTRETERKHSL